MSLPRIARKITFEPPESTMTSRARTRSQTGKVIRSLREKSPEPDRSRRGLLKTKKTLPDSYSIEPAGNTDLDSSESGADMEVQPFLKSQNRAETRNRPVINRKNSLENKVVSVADSPSSAKEQPTSKEHTPKKRGGPAHLSRQEVPQKNKKRGREEDDDISEEKEQAPKRLKVPVIDSKNYEKRHVEQSDRIVLGKLFEELVTLLLETNLKFDQHSFSIDIRDQSQRNTSLYEYKPKRLCKTYICKEKNCKFQFDIGQTDRCIRYPDADIDDFLEHVKATKLEGCVVRFIDHSTRHLISFHFYGLHRYLDFQPKCGFDQITWELERKLTQN